MKTSWALHSSVSELKQKRSSFRLKTWARVKIGDLDPKAQRSNKLAKLENATTYRKSRNWSRKMRVCNPSCLRVASFPELKWNNHELNPQLKSAKVPREVEQVQCVSFTIIVECNDWLIGSLQSPSRSLCNRKRAFIRYSTRRWHPIFYAILTNYWWRHTKQLIVDVEMTYCRLFPALTGRKSRLRTRRRPSAVDKSFHG